MPLKACQYKHSTNTTKTHYKSHKTHNTQQHTLRTAGLMLASTINLTTHKKRTPAPAHPCEPRQIPSKPPNNLMPQSSTVCQPHPPTTTTTFHTHTPERAQAVLATAIATRRSIIDDSTSEHHQCQPHGPTWKTQTDDDCAGYVLLRKEVIQPHLPVRLPCYDFVPIASPTFDSSPHTRWLGHWLRVLPTFVT